MHFHVMPVENSRAQQQFKPCCTPVVHTGFQKFISVGGILAKRFTDTKIWDKPWFRKLCPKLKETWRYLCDRCDHAGVWDIDLETLSHFVGEAVTFDEIKNNLSKQIIQLSETKILVKGFIEFQYNTTIENLNPANKVHFSIINILEKYGACKGLERALHGCKDKEPYKDNINISDAQNSGAILEASFNPEKKLIEESLKKVFKGHIPPSIRRSIPTILVEFKSAEHFNTFLESIWNNEKADPQKNASWMSYLTKCVLNEVGVR